MTDLFEIIRQEQPRIPGWCSLDKSLTLASLVVALRPAISLEIGIYGGSSIVPILLAHKWTGLGVVVGIEPWSADEAMKAQTNPTDVEWWGKQNYGDLHFNFQALIQRLGVADILMLHRKPSRHVEPPPGIGLLHIDGAHDNVAIQDVVRFAPQVVIGGVCVMDDLNWSGGAVTRAAMRLEQLGFRLLYPIGTGAVYQRVR